MKLKWILIFSLILALTQGSSIIDFSAIPSFLGFPKWLYYFALVHIIFVVALHYFSQSADNIDDA